MRKFLVFLFASAFCAVLFAGEVTLPAAASIVGGAPFFSDVRAFNTSYTNSLTVTANYHCFIPQPCAAGVPSVEFTLAPRESRAFNDMVAATFQAPDTAGGVEFEFSGADEQLVVTSRLYSTAPTPTVGMFIPGLPNSEAHGTTVLTSIRNRGPGAGFRTNPGVYNREDGEVSVTFTIFDAGTTQVGTPVTRTVAGHSGVQVSGIFSVAGQPDYATENAVIVVSSSDDVFSYAAVIDNNTTDPIFVRGAEDQPQQPITPVATATPGQPTATPTQPAATPTPTPPAASTRTVNVGPGGSTSFRDSVSGTSTSTIQVGDTIRWVWVSGDHSSTSGPCPPCSGDGLWNSGIKSSGTFQRTFSTAGTFPYFCIPHTTSMTGTVVVNP